MTKLLLFLTLWLMLSACNNKKQGTNESPFVPEAEQPASFFPVTNYIKGQISEIKNSSINPIKIDSSAGKIDSTWIKTEQFEEVFKDFLQPEIDSTNLRGLFKESTFSDLSLDTHTLTYSPVGTLPDSIQLRRWDVLISRTTRQVERIFMIKEVPPQKQLQLTWQSGKYCKIVQIATDKQGKQFVEKEHLIKWIFD